MHLTAHVAPRPSSSARRHLAGSAHGLAPAVRRHLAGSAHGPLRSRSVSDVACSASRVDGIGGVRRTRQFLRRRAAREEYVTQYDVAFFVAGDQIWRGIDWLRFLPVRIAGWRRSWLAFCGRPHSGNWFDCRASPVSPGARFSTLPFLRSSLAALGSLSPVDRRWAAA